MRKALVLLTVLATAGCTTYVEQQAVFVAYNLSNYGISVIVNGGEAMRLTNPGSARFPVTIMIPMKRLDNPSAPDVVDRTVQVSVSFVNLATNQQKGPIFCDAGAKIVTHVWYEEYAGGNVNVSCRSSYPQF